MQKMATVNSRTNIL